MLLGLVIAIPVPTGDLTSRQDVALLLIWVGTLCQAWSLWFRRDLTDLFWVVALLGAFLAFLFNRVMMPGVLLVVWRTWLWYRERRTSHLSLVILTGLSLSAWPSLAEAKVAVPKSNKIVPTSSTAVGDNAAYLKGYKINDLTSCRQVDVVPWTFGEDNRQARMLLRDRLRLSTEMHYSDWSIFQTMDPDGEVTFIFQRLHPDGAKEFQLTKGSTYNRIIQRNKTREVSAVKDLKNLIDSPALEFYHEDGSRISFMPGSSGSSKLRVYLAPRPGARILPPLYLEGRHCSRPESAFDQDDDSGKRTPGSPATPSAPVVGGAAGAGGSSTKK